MQRVDRNDASSDASTEAGWTHQRDRGWCECLDWMGLCVGLVMRQPHCAVMSLDAESSPASAASGKYFARMYTQCKGWMQSELRFGGSAMLQQQCKVSTVVQCFNSSAKFQRQCKVSTVVWGGSECGIRQHSRQIIHQWIIPAKHYSGDFNSSWFSYDLIFNKSVLIIFILR